MTEKNIALYCSHCDKSYTIQSEALELMRLHHHHTLIQENNRYVFEKGCFFKELALIRRQNQK